MAATLYILTNRDSPKDGCPGVDVDANDTDRLVVVPEHQWKVARPAVVRVVRVVDLHPASLEEDNATRPELSRSKRRR